MSTDLSTPVLLRRIAQLEATVGRLSEDLGNFALRSASKGCNCQGHGAFEPEWRTPSPPPRTTCMLRPPAAWRAAARGEAARVQWVKDGLVVPGEQLAQAWGLTRQALAPAADRGEVFRGEGRQPAVLPAGIPGDGPRGRGSHLPRAR
jgi:hypothetical protein